MSSPLSVQEMLTNLFHESIRFTVPTLIALLDLSFQLSNYPVTMCLAGCALLVYFLAISGQFDFSLGGYSAACISHNCMIWSGKLLVGLLASLLFPHNESVRLALFFPVWVLLTERWLLLLIFNRSCCFFRRLAQKFSPGGTLLPR